MGWVPASAADGRQAPHPVHGLCGDWERPPPQLVGRHDRAAEIRRQCFSWELQGVKRLVRDAGADAVQPRAALHAARYGERCATELLCVQPVRAYLHACKTCVALGRYTPRGPHRHMCNIGPHAFGVAECMVWYRMRYQKHHPIARGASLLRVGDMRLHACSWAACQDPSGAPKATSRVLCASLRTHPHLGVVLALWQGSLYCF